MKEGKPVTTHHAMTWQPHCTTGTERLMAIVGITASSLSLDCWFTFQQLVACLDFQNFREQVRNILDWGKDERLKHIRGALDIILEEKTGRALPMRRSLAYLPSIGSATTTTASKKPEPPTVAQILIVAQNQI